MVFREFTSMDGHLSENSTNVHFTDPFDWAMIAMGIPSTNSIGFTGRYHFARTGKFRHCAKMRSSFTNRCIFIILWINLQLLSAQQHNLRRHDDDSNRNQEMHVPIESLLRQFPSLEHDDAQRFHVAFGNDASMRLHAYFQWKREHNVDSKKAKRPGTGLNYEKDAANWKVAMIESFQFFGGSRKGQKGQIIEDLPIDQIPEHQAVFAPTRNGRPLLDKDGHRIFHIFPCRMDLNDVNNSKDIYLNTIAEYLEYTLHQERGLYNHDKVTILVDIRPGRSWANPEMSAMIDLARHASDHIGSIHPGRLHQAIIYPVPRVAFSIWGIVRNFLGKAIRDRVAIVPGRGGRHDPVPKAGLTKYLDASDIDLLESHRLDIF